MEYIKRDELTISYHRSESRQDANNSVESAEYKRKKEQ